MTSPCASWPGLSRPSVAAGASTDGRDKPAMTGGRMGGQRSTPASAGGGSFLQDFGVEGEQRGGGAGDDDEERGFAGYTRLTKNPTLSTA